MNIKKDSNLFLKDNPLNLHWWSRQENTWHPNLLAHIDKCIEYNNIYHPKEIITSQGITEYLRTTLVKEVPKRRRIKIDLLDYFDKLMPYEMVKARFDRGERHVYPEFESYNYATIPSAIKKIYGNTPVSTFLHIPYGTFGINTDYVMINGHGMVLYNNRFILKHADGCVKLSNKKVSVTELLTKVLQIDVSACKYIPKKERSQ